ncbi:MAG: TonB-dependent receptor [Cyanobacteria bacterium]|nr:TonB-dependent receptor [Cyanobacteriota bacterium]
MKSSCWLKLSAVLLALGLPVQTVAQTIEAPAQVSGVLAKPQQLMADNVLAQGPTPPAANPDVVILAPIDGTVLNVPSTPLMLRYGIGSRVDVRVNGAIADPALVGRTETDPETGLETQTWYGLALKEGENLIEVTATRTEAGKPMVSTARVVVQVRGNPMSLRLSAVETRIPADGRSTATVRGELVDEAGNLTNRNIVITLATNAGEFIGTDVDPEQPGFQVRTEQGQFTATLRSSLTPETVNISAKYNELEAFTQLQFETALRPSIATGVIDFRLGARGTDFYRSFREFVPADRDNRVQFDATAAVFATGAIGEWLFTGAYNSFRPLNQICDGTSRLFRDQQDCDRAYPVYGDSSTNVVVTPSQDSLFLKLERTSPVQGAGTDFVMWGDYSSQEFSLRSQQFTAFNRQLHGFKGNFNIGDLQITALYGDNIQGFQRDTIPPDGTSGFYFLSRRLLVQGSETVYLEAEELQRPGTVVSRTRLNRGADYEIDYERGTLLFRRRIARTDVDLATGVTLVQRIVATYQYDDPSSRNNLYAGRIRYHFSREQNREAWIGATYLRENQGVRSFELYGADLLLPLWQRGSVIAEIARSHNNLDVFGATSGNAYRVEVEGQPFPNVDVRAYYRSADAGFSNNSTLSFTPGQTRYGVYATAPIFDSTRLRIQYDHEDNFGIASRPLDIFEELIAPRTAAVPGSRVDNSLNTYSIGIQQKLGTALLDVDFIHRDRTDRINPSTLSGSSDQLRSRFTYALTENLTFIAQNELTLSSTVDAVYTDRTVLGVNWTVMPGITLSAAQQFYTRGQFQGQAITSFGIAAEHKIGEDTKLIGRYTLLGGNNGMVGTGSLGIQQGIRLAPGLRVDLAYERIIGSFFGATAAGTQFAQPFAVGQSAAALGVQGGDNYSIGIEYTDSPDFKASARYEFRTSSVGSNNVLSVVANGKITPGLTALVRYQLSGSSNQTITGLGDTAHLRLGLAYRDPHNDSFNALLRYEYRQNPSTIPNTILLGSGTGSIDNLFAAEAIYAPNWQWEFYGKFAIRNSVSYLARDLAGTSTISLTQLRATYRLGYHWDLVAEGRWIGQGSLGFNEFGVVAEVGYYLTPNLRVAVGYSSGSVNNDRDFSGSRSAGGPYVGLTFKLNELFDGFGLQRVAPPQQQESVVQPVAQTNSLGVGSDASGANSVALPSDLQLGDCNRQDAGCPTATFSAPLSSLYWQLFTLDLPPVTFQPITLPLQMKVQDSSNPFTLSYAPHQLEPRAISLSAGGGADHD